MHTGGAPRGLRRRPTTSNTPISSRVSLLSGGVSSSKSVRSILIFAFIFLLFLIRHVLFLNTSPVSKTPCARLSAISRQLSFSRPLCEPSDAGVPKLRLLRTPSHEPYRWSSRLPSSGDCRRSGVAGADADAFSKGDLACRALIRAMIVLYIAGCAPLHTTSLSAHTVPRLIVPRKCFEKGLHFEVTKDILWRYLMQSCEVPRAIRWRLKRIAGKRELFDVRLRARTLAEALDPSGDIAAVCGGRGIAEYAYDENST